MPAWLAAGGPEGDVAVASRVRLARNLADASFPAQMQLGPASDLVRRADAALQGALRDGLGLVTLAERSEHPALAVVRRVMHERLRDPPPVEQ